MLVQPNASCQLGTDRPVQPQTHECWCSRHQWCPVLTHQVALCICRDGRVSCNAGHAHSASCKASLDPRLRRAAAAHPSQSASQLGNALPLPASTQLVHALPAELGQPQIAAPKAEHRDAAPAPLLKAVVGGALAGNLAAERHQLLDDEHQLTHPIACQAGCETHPESGPLKQQQQQQQQQQGQLQLQSAPTQDASQQRQSQGAATDRQDGNAQQIDQQHSGSMSSLSPSLQLDIPGFHSCLASDASSYLHHHEQLSQQPQAITHNSPHAEPLGQHLYAQTQGRHDTLLDVAEGAQQQELQLRPSLSVAVTSQDADMTVHGLTAGKAGLLGPQQPQQASRTIVTQASGDVLVDVVQDTQPAEVGEADDAAGLGTALLPAAELEQHSPAHACPGLLAAALPAAWPGDQLMHQHQHSSGIEQDPDSRRDDASQPAVYPTQREQQQMQESAEIGYSIALSAGKAVLEQMSQSAQAFPRQELQSNLSMDANQAGSSAACEYAANGAVQAETAGGALPQVAGQGCTADTALPGPSDFAQAASSEAQQSHQRPADTQPSSDVTPPAPPEVCTQQPSASGAKHPSYTDSQTTLGLHPQEPAGSSAQQHSGHAAQHSSEQDASDQECSEDMAAGSGDADSHSAGYDAGCSHNAASTGAAGRQGVAEDDAAEEENAKGGADAQVDESEDQEAAVQPSTSATQEERPKKVVCLQLVTVIVSPLLELQAEGCTNCLCSVTLVGNGT